MTVENEIGRLKQLQTKKVNESLTDEEQKELSNLLKKITTYLKKGMVKKSSVFGICPELDAVIDGLEGGGSGGTSPVPAPEPEPEPEPEEPKKRKYKP